MRTRQLPPKLPVVWLFADARLGDGVAAAVARLPRGAGVIDAGTPDPALLRRLTRARGLLLIDLADPRIAKAHNRTELVAARRCGARLVFVSPVFATRSHPGATVLGVVRFGLLTRRARVPVAALGGMTVQRFRRLRALSAVAWGAIDALLA